MLVLLHGFVGHPSFWAPVQAHLSTPSVALDLPGHGGTAVPKDWTGAIDTIAATLRTLHHAPIAVGYSLGARLGLDLLARGHLRALIAIGCNPGLDDADRAARITADDAWADRFAHEPMADVLSAWQAQPTLRSWLPADHPEHARRRARRLDLDGPSMAATMRACSLGRMPDLRPAVGAHLGSLAWWVGAHDTKFHGIASALATAHPTLCVDTLAEAGHDPTLDVPATLATAITQQLARWQIR